MPDSPNWYVLQGGRWVGPMDRDRVQQMVRAGQISGSDLVAQEGMQAGIRAADAGFVQGRAVPTPAGDPDLASRGRRLGAPFIDALIAIVFQVPTIALFIAAVVTSDPGASSGGALVIVAMLSLYGMGFVCLAFQGYLVATSGQTVGKRLLHIRIVKEEDDSLPGFGRGVAIRMLLNSLFAAWFVYGIAD